MTDPQDAAGSEQDESSAGFLDGLGRDQDDELDDGRGEVADGGGSGEPGDAVHASPPRKAVVAFAVALAAFVFIGVAGAALLFFLVLRIRDHTDPNHTVRATYSHRYTSCVRSGGAPGDCAATVLMACEKDRWWTQPARAGQRETICLATVGRS